MNILRLFRNHVCPTRVQIPVTLVYQREGKQTCQLLLEVVEGEGLEAREWQHILEEQHRMRADGLVTVENEGPGIRGAFENACHGLFPKLYEILLKIGAFGVCIGEHGNSEGGQRPKDGMACAFSINLARNGNEVIQCSEQACAAPARHAGPSLDNLIAVPSEIYTEGTCHAIFGSLTSLRISVLSDADSKGSYFQEDFVEFWEQTMTRILKGASNTRTLILHSDQPVGAHPVLFFEDVLPFPCLQSLSLHNFMFGQSLPVENDLLKLIIRHKLTLTHLHLVGCSVDSEDSQTWSAILQTFEQELTCLLSFSLVNQCSDESARGLFGCYLRMFSVSGIARHRQNGAWTEPSRERRKNTKLQMQKVTLTVRTFAVFEVIVKHKAQACEIGEPRQPCECGTNSQYILR
ncbi:hypothetical protein C8J57DRAFT_1220986 [Mycena rebaudengoi]|nr:hypothetical protein C8J57DRAFT_1220986 [Mycena rebaudengoi]